MTPLGAHAGCSGSDTAGEDDPAPAPTPDEEEAGAALLPPSSDDGSSGEAALGETSQARWKLLSPLGLASGELQERGDAAADAESESTPELGLQIPVPWCSGIGTHQSQGTVSESPSLLYMTASALPNGLPGTCPRGCSRSGCCCQRSRGSER